MSEAFFDRESWTRALGPALKVLGYFSAGFVILYLTFVILQFLFGLIGLAPAITTLFSFLGPLVLVFYFILVFFKVLDEELMNRPK
ncbi:MAG: hypothetical protein ACXAE3_10550 [Candidatus Kariarchaeaceae archaeon]|jgi:hypothetical protein